MRISRSSSRCQPFVEESQAAIQLCPGNLLIEPLQLGGNGVFRNRLFLSWRSCPSANMPPIQFTQRKNLGGRASEEGLVGGIHVITCNAPLAHFKAQSLACQSYYTIAGNSLQAGGDFRGVQYTIA